MSHSRGHSHPNIPDAGTVLKCPGREGVEPRRRLAPFAAVPFYDLGDVTHGSWSLAENRRHEGLDPLTYSGQKFLLQTRVGRFMFLSTSIDLE